MAIGRVYWSEVSPIAVGRVYWSEVSAYVAPASSGRVYWSEVSEVLPPATVGHVYWSEVSAAAAPAAVGRVYWAEVSSISVAAAYTLQCLPGVFVSEGAPALADYEFDMGTGVFSSSGESVDLIDGGDPFGGSASGIWAYPMPNGLSAAQVLCELHKIHGLTAGAPLAVTSATRTAGDISQSISDSAGV